MSLANPTLDDVWRLFQETDRRFQETERVIKEAAQETERRFQETDHRFQETERVIKEAAQETERRFQETDHRFQETELLVKQLSKNLGELGNRLGEFVEHLIAPAVVRLFRAQGIEVHAVYPGVSAKRNGEALEIDLLVVNDGALIGVECKSKLIEEHIDRHLARLEKLKRVLPLYRDHRVMGAVAGMVVTESVAEYAMARGLYVLCQNGDQVEVRHPSGFTPTVW
jgi:hypothetical protein